MKIITSYAKQNDGEIKVEVSLNSETGENTTCWLFPNEEGKADQHKVIRGNFATAEQAEEFATKWESIIKARIEGIKKARVPKDKVLVIKAW